jgi:purine-binding chemotaxis protein CheW
MKPNTAVSEAPSSAEPHGIGAELAGKYMTLKLGSEGYGIQILKVREIIRLMDITRVPRSDPCIRGVINLRGRVIPVLDLRARFGMDRVEPTDLTVIIVVQCETVAGPVTMGLLVDEVLEVLNIEADAIAPVPEFGEEIEASGFLLGIGKAGSRVLFLLDIDQVLTPSQAGDVAAAAGMSDAAPL